MFFVSLYLELPTIVRHNLGRAVKKYELAPDFLEASVLRPVEVCGRSTAVKEFHNDDYGCFIRLCTEVDGVDTANVFLGDLEQHGWTIENRP